MSISKNDYRQFIDEVYFLNKQKDFSGTFVDSIKGSLTLKDVDEILESKRKAYNYAFVNLTKKYGLDHDNLYDELDRIWEETESGFNKFWQPITKKIGAVGGASAAVGSTGAVTTASIGAVGTVAAVSSGVAVSGILGAWVGLVQYGVATKWRGYKKSVKQYSDEYAKSHTNK